MKLFIFSALAIVYMVVLFEACSDDKTTSLTVPTLQNQEIWEWTANGSFSGKSTIYLNKLTDGSIAINGTVHYKNSVTGDDVTCTNYNGSVTITYDSLYKVIAYGNYTNTNPIIPVGFDTSKCDEISVGTIKNGKAVTTTTYKFYTQGWPSGTIIEGTGIRISGSGVTP